MILYFKLIKDGFTSSLSPVMWFIAVLSFLIIPTLILVTMEHR